ncbi:MAG: DUF4276 family protein [Bacteroidales bacterium]|nr:DUF4276 family protein [Bacteroidales bacterium]
MKRLSIIVEGQTEKEFVNDVLAPYFHRNGIYVVVPIVIRTSKTSRGGFDNYDHLRRDICNELKSAGNDLLVTTLVDFFRMPHKLLELAHTGKEMSHLQQLEAVERFMMADINDYRFVPYIQMHEFEALLFADNHGFEAYFDETQYMQTSAIISQYPNPEDINTSPNGAPSKRLLKIKPNYDKIVDGNVIAIEVGIDSMLSKCPRFRRWIEVLVSNLK